MGKRARLKKLQQLERLQEKKKGGFFASLRSKAIQTLLIDLIGLLVLVFSGMLLTKIMLPGYFQNFDADYHAAALGMLLKALKEGQFPVRWTDWIHGNGGYSQPLFSFYQVGFYYLAGLTHKFLGSITESIKLTTLLLWWFGGFFVYLNNLKLGRLPALVSAMIFIFAPYLIVDVFVRGAFGEFMAICLFPAVFYFLNRFLSSSSPTYLLWLTLFCAILIVAHVPTFLIFSPVILVWILIQHHKLNKKKILALGLSGLFSLLMSAFYWLPVLTETSYVQLSELLSGYYKYSNHFVKITQLIVPSWGYGPSGAEANQMMSFQLGIVPLTVFIIGMLVFIFSRPVGKNRNLIFWLGCFGFAGFMTLSVSGILWKILPPLTYVLFPWRFLIIIPFSGAMIGGYLISKIKNPLLAIFLSLVIIFTSYFAVRNYLKPFTWVPHDTVRLDFPPESESFYLPKGVKAEDYKGERLIFKNASGSAKVISFADHKLIANTSSDRAAEIVAAIHYFPGWKAKVDGNVKEIKKEKNGFMVIELPDGNHKVEFVFANTPVRSAANIISLVAIICWITGLFYSLVYLIRKKFFTKHPAEPALASSS